MTKALGISEDDDTGSDDSNNDECDSDNKQSPPNQGKLIVDATYTPADIAYPTDLSLLNEAREKSEEIIDAMHEPLCRDSQKASYVPSKGP